MEKYNLTQTGQEVQAILDNATPQSDLTVEVERAQEAEGTLQGNIDIEERDRKAADATLQDNIDAEETRAKAAERQNADDIDALEALLPSGVSQSNKLVAQQALEAIIALIPSAASDLNQLADKAFVNSSIATNTATFRGTFNLVSDLHLPIDANHETIALNLLTVTPTADNNDFCYVQIPDSAETPTVIASTDRYKFNGTEWNFEYTLNTSGFTSAQWEAINSGITSAILESLTGIPALIPSEATDQNQLADKAYVLTQILLATPAFKGQFTTLAQLQAVTGAKAGDLGIVRTKDTDGHDVFTFYQYKDGQWNEFYSLSYHPQRKPASTGLVGEAPYNGMGRVELPMNWVEGWPNDTWLYYPYNDVVYLMYYWNGLLYAPYNSGTQEGLGLDDNLVVKPLDYNIADIEQFVGQRYLPFTESSGVWTITKPDDSTITSTEMNNTNIYKINDPTHLGINVLTQAMLNRPNTIYVIQHDYDLNGATITIPANCVLEFDGGSLSNGILVGNMTQIIAAKSAIFTNIAISGNWNVTNIYSKWFANVTSENVIKQVFNLANAGVQNIIEISEGEHLVSTSTDREDIIMIPSNTELILNGDIRLKTSEFNYYNILVIDNANNVKISGSGSVIGDIGDSGDQHIGTEEYYGHGVRITRAENVKVEGIEIKNCFGDGVAIGGTVGVDENNISVINCHIHNVNRNGVSIVRGTNIIVFGCYIHNVSTADPRRCVDIEPNTGFSADNIVLSKNIFENELGVSITGYQVGVVYVNDNIFKCAGNTSAIISAALGINKGTVFVKGNIITGSVVTYTGYFEGNQIIDVNIQNRFTRAIIRNNEFISSKPVNFSICEVNNNIFKQEANDTNSTGVVIEDTNFAGNTIELSKSAENYYFNHAIMAKGTKDNIINNIIFTNSITVTNIIAVKLTPVGMIFGNTLDVKFTINKYTQDSSYAGFIIGKQEVIAISSDSEQSKAMNGDSFLNTAFGDPKPCWRFNSTWIDADGFDSAPKRGSTANRPKGIGAEGGVLRQSRDVGFSYYDKSLGKILYAAAINDSDSDGGVAWKEVDGASANIRRSGLNSQRPATAGQIYEGFVYMIKDYDNNIHKPIFANIHGDPATLTWYETDGAVAGTARSGPFSQKPGSGKYVGFQYFNTDTHKMITWDGTKWYNPDGTEATE